MSERDPIRDLENFGTGGVPMTPLPASEVRRLGDRRRARRNALMATGAVAAIAAIATPFAFLGGGSEPHPTPPATSSTELTQIPPDFPLGRGAQDFGTDGTTQGPGKGVGVAYPTPCGTIGVETEPAIDRLGFRLDAPEFIDRRELVTFADEAAAERAMAAIKSGVTGCPSETHGGGFVRTWTELTASTGQPSVSFAETVEPMGGTVYQYTRVGNAILTVQWSGEGWTPTGAQRDIGELSAITKQIVPAMCIFSAGPCTVDTGSATPAPAASPTGTAGDIPEGFPLTLDQHAMEGDGGEFIGPSRDAPGVTAEICGVAGFSMAPVDRLASTATGPEYADSRQVTTYATATEATHQMNAIRARLDTCRTQPSDDSTLLYHRYQPDTGYEDSITYGTTYDVGTGGELVQIVRVGRAILAVSNYGEFVAESQQEAVPFTTNLSKRILPAMCTFTAAGC
jgi:hypothetical protein